MFRKAKLFSKHFGLKKHSSSDDDDENSSDEEDGSNALKDHNTEMPHFLLTVDRASTHNSAASNQSESNSNSASFPTVRTLSNNSSNAALGGAPLAQLGRSHTSPCFTSESDNLARRLSEVAAMETTNLELLLSMETQARMDAQAEKEKEEKKKKKSNEQQTMAPPRPTRIKFELPTTPPRSRSPSRLAYPRARPIRSLQEEELSVNTRRHSVPPKKPKRPNWRHLFSDRDDDDDEIKPLPITFGSRVRLIRRPLPTFGYVKYIGGVHFGKGEWIGIELDHGVGNCDGTVDGKFYFETDHNRGIFCKRHDLEAVAD